MPYLTHERMEKLRKRLVERAQVLMDELELELHVGALIAERSSRDADDMQTTIAAAAAERDSAELRAISHALARMRAGDYGLCATCGAELPFKRLDAVPEAERCVACEAALEAKRARLKP